MSDSHKTEGQAKERLQEIYAKIKEFEQRAKDLRAELDEELEDLKDKDSKLYRSYEDIKYSSAAAFHDIRQGFAKAADTLHEAIKRATYHFK
ncbi:hypothetical protein PZB74_13750 [Porifericola rhodea]|uniref:hypothetical protein n=1 Tax=Porifericola rhodea TaxID=930972 RepID=UPI002666E8AF|nr:hypothetical protein [Porifericola rhodea]WKN30027.1 hypothetical protein PZB74_13750 [Porifericola rhodea]